jgi:hypothetical protein
MRHFSAVVLSALAALLLAACATDVKPDTTTGLPRLEVQNKGLSPGNGGVQIEASALRSGDIVLSSANGVGSVGIQLVTLSPVSHAALYGGNGNVVEAVGQGIRRRPVADMVAEEATVVVFRHPALTPDQAHAMHAFFDKHVGQKYNYFGVSLRTQAFAGWRVFQRLCTNSPCFAAGAVRRGDLCGGEKRRLRVGALVRASLTGSPWLFERSAHQRAKRVPRRDPVTSIAAKSAQAQTATV